MLDLIRRLWKDEEGQGMVEYGLIVVLVSLAAIVGLNLLGLELDEVFDAIQAKLAARPQ